MTTAKAPGMRPLRERLQHDDHVYYVHYEYDTDNEPCNLSVHLGGDYLDDTAKATESGLLAKLRVKLVARLAAEAA